MCGRVYSTFSNQDLLDEVLKKHSWKWPVDESIPTREISYNQCPSQSVLVLAVREGKLKFSAMRWGLVPVWAKSVKDAAQYSLINARAEEIAEKRSYKAAFQKRRCVVPVSGFFEWKSVNDQKTPFAISRIDESPLRLAGVWEHWVSPVTGEVVDSFSLITTAANDLMKPIHHRMPVILDSSCEEEWLDPENSNLESLQKLLKPSLSSELKASPISRLVNSPKNNSPEVLEPVG